MIRLAITGGLACGKSLLGSFLQEQGCAVCDADALGHALLQRGQAVHAEVVRRFGESITDGGGRIDRQRLARLVFSDAEALRDLNRLMHPVIRQRWQQWLLEREADHRAAAVLIPLFYEVGEPPCAWDSVVCVAAPELVCRRRLRRRGWSAGEIDQRLQAQWPLAEKIQRADVVFDNSGKQEWLRQQADIFYRNRCQSEK